MALPRPKPGIPLGNPGHRHGCRGGPTRTMLTVGNRLYPERRRRSSSRCGTDLLVVSVPAERGCSAPSTGSAVGTTSDHPPVTNATDRHEAPSGDPAATRATHGH